jgi:hypothetical protein
MGRYRPLPPPPGCGMSGWIGVDLDGTLAVNEHHYVPGQIGKPVPLMLERVKAWLRSGEDVRIFTARVADPESLAAAEERVAIEAWCAEHVGRVLPVTATKDYEMIQCWDDRAVGVEQNTGRVISLGGGA